MEKRNLPTMYGMVTNIFSTNSFVSMMRTTFGFFLTTMHIGQAPQMDNSSGISFTLLRVKSASNIPIRAIMKKLLFLAHVFRREFGQLISFKIAFFSI